MAQLIINAPLLAPMGGGAPMGAPVAGNATHPPMIPHNLANPVQAQLHGAQQVNAAPLPRFAGQVAPNQEGFWAKVGRWFKEGTVSNTGLPPTVTVRIPNGHNVDFRGEELAPMIRSLPRMQREDARANLAQILAIRLENGHDILDSITSGQPVGVASSENIADLMLFISTSAKASGADFSSGAFSVDDPQGHLANYLYGSTETYQRSSSHMESQQGVTINDRLNTHRGIDIKQGLGGLPHGHGTLLFCGIPGTHQGEDRLFLKMESHGCRLNTLRASHRDQHVEPDRDWKSSDIPEALGHTFSFLSTRGAGSATGSRKERIPDDVKKEFKTLAAAYEHSPHQALLSQGTPLDNGAGIKVIMANLQRLSAAVAHDPAQRAEFIQRSAGVRTALSQLAEVNDMNVRIGNEVTRTLGDLLSVTDHPAQTQAEKLSLINLQCGIVG